MKKFERKTVTVSVTPEEYDAVSHAISEYLRGGTINRDFENNINSFQKKYWRAVRTQHRRDVIKKALIYAKSKE